MDDLTSLMVDPNAMGAPPGRLSGGAPQGQPQHMSGPGPGVTIGIDPSQDMQSTWARIQDYARRGLISPEQMQKLSQKLGMQQKPQTVADHAQPGSDVASNLGGVLGAGVGGVANKLSGYMNETMQPKRLIDRQDAVATDRAVPRPPSNIEQGVGNPPSPQWNQ